MRVCSWPLSTSPCMTFSQVSICPPRLNLSETEPIDILFLSLAFRFAKKERKEGALLRNWGGRRRRQCPCCRCRTKTWERQSSAPRDRRWRRSRTFQNDRVPFYGNQIRERKSVWCKCKYQDVILEFGFGYPDQQHNLLVRNSEKVVISTTRWVVPASAWSTPSTSGPPPLPRAPSLVLQRRPRRPPGWWTKTGTEVEE